MYSIYADLDLVWFQGVDEEEYFLTDIQLSEEINVAGSLEFTVPITNKYYNDFVRLKTTITVRLDTVQIWRGRVLQTRQIYNNSLKVYCEGQLSFLSDSIVRPYYGSYSPAELLRKYLNDHNSAVPESRKIFYGNVTVTDPFERSNIGTAQYPTTFKEMNEKLSDRLGGYLIPRWTGFRWELDYLDFSDLPISEQSIDFDTNLIDFERFIDTESVYTRLIPLGAKDADGYYLTIKSVNNDIDYIDNQTGIDLYGVITKTNVWEDVTLASNLLTKGRSFLQKSITDAVTIDIKAVDMYYISNEYPHINLGDKVLVKSTIHDINDYFVCSGIKRDLENPSNDSFTFGTPSKTIVDRFVKNYTKV